LSPSWRTRLLRFISQRAEHNTEADRRQRGASRSLVGPVAGGSVLVVRPPLIARFAVALPGRSRQKRWQSVLVYSPTKASQATVRRSYRQWRQERGLPDRCDNPGCAFHTQPLAWNGKPLPLILDHIDGNKRDNRAEMLRFLCPNCDSQLLTRGGANKGRVVSHTGNSFLLMSRDGRKSYTYFPSGAIRLGGSAKVLFHPAREKKP
jgi:hypothetical protein